MTAELEPAQRSRYAGPAPLPAVQAADLALLYALADLVEVPCRTGEVLPPETWTSDDLTDLAAAGEVCKSCPLYAECTDYGRTYRPEGGRWGKYRRAPRGTREDPVTTQPCTQARARHLAVPTREDRPMTDTQPRDTDLDNAVALARAIEVDKDAFAQIVTEMDCAEHHRAILWLVYLVRDAYGSSARFAEVAEVFQDPTAPPPWMTDGGAS